jgi:hypothetical protein
MSTAFFGPWVGEFGWELMAWQGFCRLKAKEYDKVYVSSFPDMEYLYHDFVDEFIPHNCPNRKQEFGDIADVKWELRLSDADLAWIDSFTPFKEYRVPDQHFIQYGEQSSERSSYDVLIHARNIRFAHKNYPEKKWEEIVNGIQEVLKTDRIASIGKAPDLHIANTYDLRGVPLNNLCDRMASSKVVIGGSSGVMHLATLCNTPIIVWGDRRTYFNETLEKRYTKTWNPFGSEVSFVFTNKIWQPDPHEIINIVQTKCLGKLSSDSPLPAQEIIEDESKTLEIGTDAAEALTQAVESGRYLLTISWITGENSKGGGGSNYKFAHNLTKQDFPDDQVIHCLNHFRKQDSQSPSVKAELKQLLSTELDGKKRFS